jgi:hypothetical protein
MRSVRTHEMRKKMALKSGSASKNKHLKNRFVQCYQEKFSELANGVEFTQIELAHMA